MVFWLQRCFLHKFLEKEDGARLRDVRSGSTHSSRALGRKWQKRSESKDLII